MNQANERVIELPSGERFMNPFDVFEAWVDREGLMDEFLKGDTERVMDAWCQWQDAEALTGDLFALTA